MLEHSKLDEAKEFVKKIFSDHPNASFERVCETAPTHLDREKLAEAFGFLSAEHRRASGFVTTPLR